MITEDQLAQLAIQWFQDTGWNYVHGAVIAPEGVAAEREDFRAVVLKGRLAEARRRDAMPGQAVVGNTVGGIRAARARACCLRQVGARGWVENRDMNRDMVLRFGSESGGKWGIPTKCRDSALVEGKEAESRQLSRHHVQFRCKKDHGMGRPFRAWNPVGDETQGGALGCRMVPRWGVYNSQGFLVSQNQIKRKLNP
jgi:hypothetical protein